MEFPFNTGVTYLTQWEEQDFQEFREREPLPGWIYTNDIPESRHVVRVDYPTGAVTELTVYGEMKPDKTRPYHTPQAKLSDRPAHVTYRDLATGEWKFCNSKEWLQWLGPKPKMKEHKSGGEIKIQKIRATMIATMKKSSETQPETEDKAKKRGRPRKTDTD